MIAGQEARARGMAPMGAGGGSAVSAYLERLHATHGGIDEGEVATYIPELSRADPSLFGICLATVDGAVYEAGDTHAAVHDPVDVEAADVRACARASRDDRRAQPHGRRAERRRVQRDQPLPRDRDAAQPADQRRRDRLCRARRERQRGSVRAAARDVLALRRPRARDRRVRLPVGARHGAPQPRHGAHPAQLRRDRRRRRRARPLLPPVLGLGRLPRPRRDRSDARERRRQPADGRARGQRGGGARRPQRDGLVRHVRLRGRMARVRRAAGQERRLGRRPRGAARAGSGSASTRRGSTRRATPSAGSPSAASSRRISPCISYAPESGRHCPCERPTRPPTEARSACGRSPTATRFAQPRRGPSWWSSRASSASARARRSRAASSSPSIPPSSSSST